MKVTRSSRRDFLKRSVSIPAGLACSSLLPFATFANPCPPGCQESVADLERISALLKEKNAPVIWLFTGDSITHGAKHTHGYRSYPEIFAERIRWELGRVRDVIINTGISGNTTKTILDDFEWRVKQFNPGVVSLMIGTNDCAKSRIPIGEFESNLHSLVKHIRDLNAVPILHTPNIIITEKDPTRSALGDYVAVIREVAEIGKVVLVDNYEYWLDTYRNNGASKVYGEWLNDPLHPDGDGHAQIARLMFKKLSIFDKTASTCGGLYYEGEH